MGYTMSKHEMFCSKTINAHDFPFIFRECGATLMSELENKVDDSLPIQSSLFVTNC